MARTVVVGANTYVYTVIVLAGAIYKDVVVS